MRACDIDKLPSLSRPTVHPDGDQLVVAVSFPHLGANANVGQLWACDPHGGSIPRRITRGFRDGAPAFAPDGKALAFVRSAPGAPAQIYVVLLGQGEPILLTDAPLGVDSFRWTPDSSALVFSTRVPAYGRYGTIVGLRADEESPRRQTTLRYRSNGLGYSNDRLSQLFLVALPELDGAPAVLDTPSLENPEPASDAAARGIPVAIQITPSEFDHGAFAFSGDGAHVRVVSARHAGRHNDLRLEVYEHALGADATSKARPLLTASANLAIETIETATDDALLVIGTDVGEGGRDFVGRQPGLFVVVDGMTERLTDAENVDLGGSQLTARVGGGALAQLRDRGDTRLVEITRDRTLSVLTLGSEEVTGHDANDALIAYVFQGPGTSGDLAVIDGGEVRVLSDFSAALRETGIVPPHEITVDGRDGYPVHGWVVTPRTPGPHPVLLVIHGGPFHYYSGQLFDEAQVYVAAGYAVVLCNPRGSAGYGQAHGRAIRQRMGTLDYHDVMDFLDGVLKSAPELDSERLGVMGGSYGGYLTAWIIAHDHRFAGAIVERGFLDPAAFIGTSDIGDFFGDEYTGTDPQRMLAQSPQAVVAGVTTPTLVMHSEQDLRCPLEQAEHYYASLIRQGTTAELLVFPGEDHDLSRSGRPRHRVERFEAILDWWTRYLPITARGNS